MLVGKVVGSVVATRKNENLIGNKFLIVDPLPEMSCGSKLIAIVNVGAGIGEIVWSLAAALHASVAVRQTPLWMPLLLAVFLGRERWLLLEPPEVCSF